MQQSNFIRLALALSGSASNFKTKLGRMVEYVLYDDLTRPWSVDEIVQKISDLFGFQFVTTEVEAAIKNNSQRITRKEEGDNYFLAPNAVEAIRKTSQKHSFDEAVHRFLTEYSDCPFEEETFQQQVLDYLYATFNSDVNTILELLNSKPRANGNMEAFESLNQMQIEWINIFLGWNDPRKNQMVYQMISTCYDYCLMTVKKNNLPEMALFRGKEFYLDTNIVFRLAGINDGRNNDCVKAFVNACNAVHIKLRYTNFTYDEIKRTVDGHVHSLQRYFGANRPVGMDAVKRLSPPRRNWDFLTQYLCWLSQTGNVEGDYLEFKAYLMRLIDDCLKSVEYAQGVSADSKMLNEDFQSLASDLYGYKLRQGHDSPSASVKTDIENYLFIMALDKHNIANSFLDKKAFFITADRRYINWVRQKVPGALPIFVRPELWYSLILKYKGRVDDDYAAFCQFIKISPHILDDPSPKELEDKKLLMLERVSALNESVTIKERIIFDIDRRLHESDAMIEDVDAFVEESHEKITQECVNEAVSETEAKYEAKQKRESEGYQAVLKDKQLELETAVANAKAETEQKIRQNIITQQTARILKRHRAIRFLITVFAVVAMLAFILVGVLYAARRFGSTSNTVEFIAGKEPLISVVAICLVIPRGLIGLLAKQIDFLSTDEDKIEERVTKKICKQYNIAQ